MKIKTIVTTILLFSAFSPAQAIADECMSLWKERNGIFHERGYCFGGGLGKGYFGNEGCFTKSPSISAAEKSRVAQIQARESQLGCKAKSRKWTVAELKEADAEMEASQSAIPTPNSPQHSDEAIDLATRIQMEAFLKVIGFDPGQVDGIIDANAIAASQAFQQKFGLNVTDTLDPQNFTVLEALAMASGNANSDTQVAAESKVDSGLNESHSGADDVTTSTPSSDDVTSDVAGSAMPPIPFELEFQRVNGHATITEFGSSEVDEYLAWQNWLITNLPRFLPDLTLLRLETNIVLADLWLSPAEKLRVQEQSGMALPLFLPVDEVPETTNDPLQLTGDASRYLNALRRHASKVEAELDEFTRPVVEELFQREVSAKIAAFGKPAPLDVAQIFVAEFGEYDFDNQRFELDWGRTTPAKTKFQSLARDALQSNSAEILWDVDLREFPPYLELSPVEAQKLVNDVERISNNSRRYIYFAVYGQLNSVAVDIKSQLAENRRPEIEFNVDVSKSEFAITPNFENPFLTREHQAVSDSDIQAAFEQGTETKTSLFGAKFLRVLMGDRLMDPFRFEDRTTPMFAEQVAQQSETYDRFGLDEDTVLDLMRTELVSGESRVNVDDIAIFRSNFAAAMKSGPSKQVHIPFHANVRSRDDGSKFIDPGNAKDLLRLALIQNRRQIANFKGNANGHIKDGGEQRDADKIIIDENEGYDGDEIVSLAYINQDSEEVGSDVRVFVAVNKRELATIQNLNLPDPIAATANNSFRYAEKLTGLDLSEGVISGHITLELLDEPQRVAFSRQKNTDQQQDATYVVRAKLAQLTLVNGDLKTAVPAGELADDVAESGATPTSIGEIAELTTELSDLLTVKFTPNHLSDPDYLRMMFARWHYENAFSDPNSNPDWGRFFGFGAPLPEQSEILSTLREFKDWTQKRAEMLPDRVTITLPFDDYYFGDKADGNTPIRIGTSYRNETMMNRTIEDCVRVAADTSRDASVPKQHLAMLKNGCEYLTSATLNPGGEIFVANDRHVSTIEVDVRQSKTRDLENSSHSRHGAVGVRATCRHSWRAKEPYCLGMYQELENGLISNAHFVLDDIYQLDKIVVMTPENKRKFEASRGVQKFVRLTVGVDEVVRLQQYQMQPPRFRKALLDRFAALEAANVKDNLNPPKPFNAVPVNLFKLSASDVAVIDGRSNETLFVPELHPIVQLDEKLLQPVAAIYDPAPEQAYGPDIVGLRIGMSFVEADTIIQQHMDVGRVLYANRDWSAEEAFGNITAFSSGKLYESADGNERIVIFDEAPSAPQVIMGMTRVLKVEKGKISEKQALDGLANKYGRPSIINNGKFGWGDIPQDCLATGYNKSTRQIWKDQNGTNTGWDISSFDRQGVLLPDNDQITPNGYRADCELRLVAHFNDYSDQEYDLIVQLLHDKQQYDLHFRQSAEMLKNATPTESEMTTDVNVKF